MSTPLTPAGRPENTPNVEHTTTATEHTTHQTAPTSVTRGDSVAYQTDDHIGQEAWIGTDTTDVSTGNVSWGAIFAGVVTFLGIMILLGVGAAAMGLQGSSGAATGIFALISLAVAFAAAGYVSGATGVRAGLLHGFATWATSLIAALILAGWLGASVVGGLGSALGNVADTVANTAGQAANVTREDAEDAADAAQDNISSEDVDNATQRARESANDAARQAQDAYNEYSGDVAAGTWWTFGGLILGAVISALTGAAGARSVLNRGNQQKVVRKK